MHHTKLCRYTVVLYCVTFLVILPLICYHLPERHLPYNIMFDLLSGMDDTEHRNLHVKQNNERYEQSLKILRNFDLVNSVQGQLTPNDGTSLSMKSLHEKYNKALNGLPISIAITVITVARRAAKQGNYNPHYLVQTVAAFLREINKTKIPVHFSVCNVDPYPDKHVDMDLLPTGITVFQRFKKASPVNAPRPDSGAMFAKTKDDYMFCLEKAIEQNTSFVLVAEDDAVPKENLFSVLEMKLENAAILDEREKFEDLLYIKLFYPDSHLAFFALEWDLFERIPELFIFAAILAAFFTHILHVYTNYDGNQISKQISRRIFGILFLYFICVLLCIGRQNFIQLGRLSNQFYQAIPAPRCWTQAHLYPRLGAKIVVNYLKSVTCGIGYRKDQALDDLYLNTKYLAKMIYPNLFEDIGEYSSLKSKIIWL